MELQYHLAQVNIGKILGPMDSPVMAEFKNNLDRINALAEASKGFIWRLKDDNNNATSIERINHSRQHSDTAYAFGFKKRFTAEEAYAL